MNARLHMYLVFALITEPVLTFLFTGRDAAIRNRGGLRKFCLFLQE